MTIREHFQRRFNLIKYGYVVVGIVLGVFATWRYPHAPRLQMAIYSLLAGILSGIPLIWLLRRFVCPRCGTDLMKLNGEQFRQEVRERGWRAWLDIDTRPLWEARDACPHCGVSFDDSYP